MVPGLLIAVASLFEEDRPQAHRFQWLWYTGLAALQNVESSWIRDQTHVPCTDRWILTHCTTREVPEKKFFFNDTQSVYSLIYKIWKQPVCCALK